MECVVCTDVFKTPKSLPCGHSFCLDCVEGWAATSGKTRQNGDRLAACPECRTDFIIPKGSALNLPTNIGLARAVEDFTEYTIVDNQSIKCAKHPGCSMNFFCRDCNIPVCDKDHNTVHRRHTWITMKKKGEEIDEKLKKDLKKMDELCSSVKSRKKQWDIAKGKVKHNRRELTQHLEEMEEEMKLDIKKSIAKFKSDVAEKDEEFGEQCKSANSCAEEVLQYMNKTQTDVSAFLHKASAHQKYAEQQKYEDLMKFIPGLSSLQEPVWSKYSCSGQRLPENIIKAMFGTYKEEKTRLPGGNYIGVWCQGFQSSKSSRVTKYRVLHGPVHKKTPSGVQYEIPRAEVFHIKGVRKGDHVVFQGLEYESNAIVEYVDYRKYVISIIYCKWGEKVFTGKVTREKIPFSNVKYILQHDPKTEKPAADVVEYALAMVGREMNICLGADWTISCKTGVERVEVNPHAKKHGIKEEIEGAKFDAKKITKWGVARYPEDVIKAVEQMLEKQSDQEKAVPKASSVQVGERRGRRGGNVDVDVAQAVTTGGFVGGVLAGAIAPPLAPVGAIVGGFIGGMSALTNR